MDFLDRIRTRAQGRRLGSYLGERVRHGICELQHDMSAANGSGATVRGDYNNALESLATLSSGATAPATTFAYQLWADTTSGTLKRRNAANTGWLVVRSLDETTVLSRSSNTILDISDIGKTIRATSTFTQTFDACATLTDGWWVDYINEGTGTITLDPNSTETIEGLATIVLGPGESGRIVCNGTNLKMLNRSRYAGALAAGRNITARTNSATPLSQIDIDADELQLKDANGNVYVAASVNLTAAITASGANGLDTGAEGASTWYYGWVIYNPESNTVASLISASASAPTMPSGYTFKALATAARNNGSSNFIAYRQNGNEVFYEEQQLALNAGAAGSETAVDIAALIPPIAHAAKLAVSPNGTADGSGVLIFTPEIRVVTGVAYRNFRSATNGMGASGGYYTSYVECTIPNIGQSFFYLVTTSNGTSTNITVYVAGFKLPCGGE